MRIKYLKIENYKAIESVEMKDLGQLVLIVGGNGVGKSCIFDAIRILKSSYGSYHQNEWQNFLNEFQINIHAGQNIDYLFRKKDKSILIEIELEISKEEKEFIIENGKQRIVQIIWDSMAKYTPELGGIQRTPAELQRIYGTEFEKISKEALEDFDQRINDNSIKGRVELYRDGRHMVEQNVILDLLFSIYQPDQIGVIDYHGPNRNYQRENITNLNMS